MGNFVQSNDKLQTDSLFIRLVLILFFCLFGTILSSLVIQSIGAFNGLDYTTVVENLQKEASNVEKNFIRFALSTSHLFRFILPAIIFGWFVYQKKWIQKAKLARLPNLKDILVGSMFIIAAFPVAQVIFAFNRSFQDYFPTWAVEQETFINTITNNLLQVNSTTELFFNIFTIALLPALGEEFVFRGILQQNFEKDLKNAHLAVWITALIFSFIHFQFLGFLPRVFLGATLGYLFVWTRNLWIPIIAHFVTNAGQILLQYFYQQKVSDLDLEKMEEVPFWLAGLGLLGMVGFGYILTNRTFRKEERT